MKTTCFSHREDYLKSTVTGECYNWIAYLNNVDDESWNVIVTLIRLNEDIEKSKIKTVDIDFSSFDQAMAYINKTTARFDKFELKTLTFDQDYDQQFVESQILQWLDK